VFPPLFPFVAPETAAPPFPIVTGTSPSAGIVAILRILLTN